MRFFLLFDFFRLVQLPVYRSLVLTRLECFLHRLLHHYGSSGRRLHNGHTHTNCRSNHGIVILSWTDWSSFNIITTFSLLAPRCWLRLICLLHHRIHLVLEIGLTWEAHCALSGKLWTHAHCKVVLSHSYRSHELILVAWGHHLVWHDHLRSLRKLCSRRKFCDCHRNRHNIEFI